MTVNFELRVATPADHKFFTVFAAPSSEQDSANRRAACGPRRVRHEPTLDRLLREWTRNEYDCHRRAARRRELDDERRCVANAHDATSVMPERTRFGMWRTG
jgi:hypothetical protein